MHPSLSSLVKPLMLLFVILFFGTLVSCKKDFTGEPAANLPPDTFTAVDTIVRTGPDRLESEVRLRWWGDDPDGFVKGYEFTFDSLVTGATVWRFTTRTDSVFLLPIPPGFDSVDFRFHVRAVDNDDLRDPTPATLGVPVKNSRPSVTFVYNSVHPLRTFPVLRFHWSGSDPDGVENLKHYELVWNDTTQPPYVLDRIAYSATFEAVDPGASASAMNVYVNNALVALPQPMMGLLLADSNVLFIRAVDNSLARSAYVASYNVFVKKVTASVLLVDGYGNGGGTVTAFYAQQLQSAGVAFFDTLQIFQTAGGQYTQIAPDNLTQARIFRMFDAVVWYSNNATLSLSVGQKSLGMFFDGGGKLFMATYVAGSFDQQSTFLSFTPGQALISLPPDTALTMNNGAALIALVPDYPPLQSTQIISTVRPFALAPGATALYHAQLLAKNTSDGGTSPWNGPSVVMAKKTNASGQTNFVFSVLELQKLNGLSNIQLLFQKVFNDEFGL